MRTSRIAAFVGLLASLLLSLTAVAFTAPQPVITHSNLLLTESLIASYHGAESPEPSASRSDDLTGGIKEDIPQKYQSRYQNWKTEFLSTEAGREQWDFYEKNPHFTLFIT